MIAEMRGHADAMRRAEIDKIAEGLSAEELERLDSNPIGDEQTASRPNHGDEGICSTNRRGY